MITNIPPSLKIDLHSSKLNQLIFLNDRNRARSFTCRIFFNHCKKPMTSSGSHFTDGKTKSFSTLCPVSLSSEVARPVLRPGSLILDLFLQILRQVKYTCVHRAFALQNCDDLVYSFRNTIAPSVEPIRKPILCPHTCCGYLLPK